MISRSASYAIRALTFMAMADTEGWHLNRAIAAGLQLPPQFLTKILRTLAGHGLLLSQRGRTGGFCLARPAAEISLLDIVDPFDRLLTRRACVLGQAFCSDDHPCPLHEEWKEMSDALVLSLRNRTLADLSRNASPEKYPHPARRKARRSR